MAGLHTNKLNANPLRAGACTNIAHIRGRTLRPNGGLARNARATQTIGDTSAARSFLARLTITRLQATAG
eukprot:11175609-Lingulodinium_polyedra.AAC.1